jgi:nitroimidazol reductase NimA-like FMN-containing flavoprotein (pyridoxamine 5'-phosphate oxidase superfamily)
MKIRELDYQECIAFLSKTRMGRLSCVLEGRPYTVPISFIIEDDWFYSFSLEGKKISWMRENNSVCILADEISGPQQWRTVIANGQFKEFDQATEWAKYARAWSLLQASNATYWLPGGLKTAAAGVENKPVYYGVRIESVAGREAYLSSETGRVSDAHPH